MAKLKAITLEEFEKRPKKRLKAVPLSTIEDKEEDYLQDVKDFSRGVGQGATFGFGDEITAGAQALGELATGETSLSNLLDRYYKLKKDEQKEIDRASKDLLSPYYAGEVASIFTPGGVASKAAKYGYKGAVGLGAATGLGSSQAEILKGKDAVKAAFDTALGAGIGAAGEKVSRAIGKRLLGRTAQEAKEEADKVPALTRKFAKMVGDVDERTVEEYLKDPVKFEKDIQSRSSDIADEFYQKVPKALSSALSKSSSKAYGLTNKSTRDLKPKEVYGVYDKLIRNIDSRAHGKIIPGSIEDESIKALQKQRNLWRSVDGRIPPSLLKDRIRALDKIDKSYGRPGAMPDLLEKARRQERGLLNKILRKENIVPGYAKLMDEETSRLANLKDFSKKEAETYPKVERLLKKAALGSDKLRSSEKKLLKEVEDVAGVKLSDKFKNSLLNERIEGESTKSSRDVNKWAMVGGAVAAGLGASTMDSQAVQMLALGLGAVVGDAMSKYGKKVTFEGIKRARKLNNKIDNLSPIARNKMLSDLQNEAARKGGSYMVTLELLNESLPVIHGDD